MKIQYASDLHLEFRENTRYLRDNPIKPVGDILVLAGDIGYLDDDSYNLHPFWDWASDNFQQTLVIPGNHEFYKSGDVGTIQNGCIAEIRPNVKCYYRNMQEININGTKMLCNQLGYVHHGEHRIFNPQAYFEFGNQ
jgi:hypothetical protein